MAGVRIAFGCEARVGKDTSAAYLASVLDAKPKDASTYYGTRLFSFAEPLYKILYHAQSVCGFEMGKDRKFLQWVGTEWARSIKSDVWVNLLIERIKKAPGDANIIVTDVRFADEFEALKAAGFKMVRLIRPEKEQLGASHANHASETSAIGLPWDHIVVNDGDLSKLYAELDQLI